MVKVVEINFSDLHGSGCNNGNYPIGTLVYEINGGLQSMTVQTCRCGSGCSNTSNIPIVGAEFETEQELFNFLDREDK